MMVLFVALIIAFIPAYIAKNKGRSFAPWYIFGLLLFPVAVITSLFVGDERRTCPYCKSKIDRQATICKYCHSILPPFQERKSVFDEFNEIDNKIDRKINGGKP